MAAGAMKDDATKSRLILTGRRLLACDACGGVHYAMSADEKAQNDRALERYHLSAAERFAYESSFRQCLVCEAPLGEFRDAREAELARADGHLVTPVLADEI
jgi:hypothetical protein